MTLDEMEEELERIEADIQELEHEMFTKPEVDRIIKEAKEDGCTDFDSVPPEPGFEWEEDFYKRTSQKK